jgi:hypothetical protein
MVRVCYVAMVPPCFSSWYADPSVLRSLPAGRAEGQLFYGLVLPAKEVAASVAYKERVREQEDMEEIESEVSPDRSQEATIPVGQAIGDPGN